jgi:hypothetical protein
VDEARRLLAEHSSRTGRTMLDLARGLTSGRIGAAEFAG